MAFTSIDDFRGGRLANGRGGLTHAYIGMYGMAVRYKPKENRDVHRTIHICRI